MHIKTSLLARGSLGVFFLVLCASGAASPARAGFQWVPPSEADQGGYVAPGEPSSSSAVSVQGAASSQLNTPSFQIEPQIIEGQAPSIETSSSVLPAPSVAAPVQPQLQPVAAPAPVLSGQDVLPAPSLPALSLPAAPSSPPLLLEPTPAPSLAAPVPAQIPASSSVEASAEKNVRGFANSVPLTVALRQILPQAYGFSVAQDVSLGTQVSWRGGAPWRQVLKDMLAPAGLDMREEDQIVHIVHQSGSAAAVSAGPDLNKDRAAPSLSSSAAEGKPLSLVPPPVSSEPASSRKALTGSSLSKSLDSLPTRSVGPSAGASPKMGYLVPPSSSPAPAPRSAPALTAISSSGGEKGAYDVWTAEKGDMLHKVLETWARRANVELSWQAEYDYPLQASVFLSGSFEDVVRALLTGFQEAKPRPVGQIFQNQMAGQSVLVVQALGNNYDE